jgi:competence protein ComFC
MCENLSLSHICSSCQTFFLKPQIYKRHLSDGTEVISFYKYEEIKNLLHTKHTDLGFYIYKILAKNSFQKFAEEFHFDTRVYSLPIDDSTKSGYSHTAILNSYLKSKNIKPIYSRLRARNTLSYSGKSKQFREKNPRNFEMKDFKGELIILVDDILTTGTTLQEAIKLLQTKSKDVLFCLTLCDVANL